jgi:hypothetical protein
MITKSRMIQKKIMWIVLITCDATMFIDDTCPLFSRPVNTTYLCVKCSLSIHNICGFMQPGGNTVCNHCYNTSSNTNDPISSGVSTRRLRQETMKDTELSILWNVTQVQKSKNTVDYFTMVTKLSQIHPRKPKPSILR